MKEVTADDAIRLLNEAFAADPVAMEVLMGVRVRVNEAMQNHPTIQVGADNTLGFIGLLNGIFGVDENGNGRLAWIVLDPPGRLDGFCLFQSAAKADEE